MQTFGFNHFSIRPVDIERTKDFVGDRPKMAFPGYWLYAGGLPVLRLAGSNPGDEVAALDRRSLMIAGAGGPSA